MGWKALGSEKIVTKLSSVYVVGNTWVVQERFSEKATSAIVATGASRTIVASTEASGANQRPIGLLISRRVAEIPFDCDW
jgi:hypothetical protein